MILPSKELLSAVWATPKEDIALNIAGSYMYGTSNEGSLKLINIYELMHMMKEWANKLDKQYELNSYITQQRTGAICEVYEAWHGNTVFGDFQYEGVGVTEFEAVTKACEWILNEDI